MTDSSQMIFNEAGWEGFKTLRISETAGLARDRALVDTAFTIPARSDLRPESELRIVREKEGKLSEVPSQFYHVKKETGGISGKTAFFADIGARASSQYRLYYGNKKASAPDYPSRLSIEKGEQGPQHYFIENEFYKMETMPKSGQIWHMWNKRGSNTSWHHNEWHSNVGKGGDPCHWSPNAWVAYPERITNGYEIYEGGDLDYIDWHYAFGWEDPECEIVRGPVFFEIRRRGIVWPHPEHSRENIKRDKVERIFADVTYRFYDGVPWIYQASTMETRADMRVFFIRNCQFVFLTRVFTHTLVAPESADIRPTDEEDVAVVRLMGIHQQKPYPWIEHTFSNILPSKLAYYGYFNNENHDGFALFHTREENINIYSGRQPVYQNHATLFTEMYGFASYYCRAFAYTNQRFNPENPTFLPKGEHYEEENYCLMFRYDNIPDTLSLLKAADGNLKNPLKVEIVD